MKMFEKYAYYAFYHAALLQENQEKFQDTVLEDICKLIPRIFCDTCMLQF